MGWDLETDPLLALLEALGNRHPALAVAIPASIKMKNGAEVCFSSW